MAKRRGSWSASPRLAGRVGSVTGALVALGGAEGCGSGGDSIDVFAEHGPRPADGGVNGGAGGGSTVGSVVVPSFPVCEPPDDAADLFRTQVVSYDIAGQRTFYSWTTEAQVVELRANQVLFSRSERNGLGRGVAFSALAAFGALGGEPQHELARVLNDVVFATARFTWPNPWATRMGWPGEDYGNQLIEIQLREDAWIAHFDGTDLYVVDAQTGQIPIAEALQTPERIGGIYFVRGVDIGGPMCPNGGTFDSVVTDGNSFREFILGNIQQVERWSIGTEAIRNRLENDIAELERFLRVIRTCGIGAGSDFNDDVVCAWMSSRGSAYELSLAIPNAYYLPEMTPMAQLIDTLRGDLFEPDPLVVMPNP